MAGTIYTGNFYITASTGTPATRDAFSYIGKFLDSHNGFTRIARSGNLGATGEADESPENSYAVWRSVSSSVAFDVVMRWSYNSYWPNWRNGGGAAYGLGMLVGIHPSGQAWAGTTTNVTDIPPSSPFKSGSVLYSRSNALGGTPLSISSSQDSFITIVSNYIQQYTRIIASSDNGSLMFFSDVGNNNTWDSYFIFSKYIPSDPSNNLPFVCYNYTLPFTKENNLSYGLLEEGINQGALSYTWVPESDYKTYPSVEMFSLDYNLTTVNANDAQMPLSTSFQPYISEYPISIISNETGGGYVGYLETVRIVNPKLINGSRINSGSRFVLTGTYQSPAFSIPWDGKPYATGTFYTTPNMFFTGSDVIGSFGGSPKLIPGFGKTDSFTTIITQSVSNTILYRGFYAGNYVYSENTPPSPATDIVVIRKT